MASSISQKKNTLLALENLLLEKSHILSQLPDTLFQCSYNYSSVGPLAQLTEDWLSARGRHTHSWLRRLNRYAGEVTPSTRLLGHHSQISGCAFIDEGRFVVSAAETDPVYVWDAKTGQLETVITLVEMTSYPEGKGWSEPRAARPWIRELAASANTIGLINGFRIYLVSPPDWCATDVILDSGSGGQVRHITAASDTFFVTIFNRVCILDEKGEVKQRLLEHERRLRIDAVAVTPNGSHLATVDESGLLIVSRRVNDRWEPTLELLVQIGQLPEHRIHDEPIKPELVLRPLAEWDWKKNYRGCDGLSLSPDGRYLALRGGMHSQVFDLLSLKSICRLDNKRYWMSFITMAPNGSHLAFPADRIGPFKPIGLVDLATKTCEFLLLRHGDSCTKAAFSPHGGLLAIGSLDRTISIVRTEAAQPLDAFPKMSDLPQDSILGCVVSQDRRVAASWSIDHRVAAWNLEDGALLFATDPLGKPSANYRIIAIGLSPHCDFLYVSQNHNRLRIWRIVDHALELVFDTEIEIPANERWGNKSGQPSCAFSSDSKRAGVVSDKYIWFIDLDSGRASRKAITPPPACSLSGFDIRGNLVVTRAQHFTPEVKVPLAFALGPLDENFKPCEFPNERIEDYTGIWPSNFAGSLEIINPSGPHHVQPGPRLVATIHKKLSYDQPETILASFSSDAEIRYAGIVPETDYFVIGDMAGTFYILKREKGFEG